MELDLRYLCTQIGNLSGVPVRLLRGTECVFFHAIAALPVDPALPYREALSGLAERVGCFTTEDLHHYGVVRVGELTLAVGPTRQVPSTDQELRALAFRADVPRERLEEFLTGMKSIVRMPLESMLQMLCVVNYVLNGEKLELRDLMIREDAGKPVRQPGPDGAAAEGAPHNTLALEERLMDYVRRGDAEALRAWFAAAPAVRSGNLAAEQLRQRKNLFIVTATLASRAAIQGGLDSEEALSLSDRYIQSCELLRSPREITELQYHMLLDYTERVDSLRRGRQPGQLALAVSNYVRGHLSEPVTVEQLARALYLSRPYLSARFKRETGETLTDFILREKIGEARRFLRYTDKTASAIGDYLGFSSLGHFSRTFRKYEGLTPREYRAQYRD